MRAALHFKNLIRLCLSFCVAVFVLNCFCYIYSYSGVHITNETGATDYKWMPNQWKATMTEGFAWFHMDASGFNNASEKARLGQDNTDILIMGSSHMEGVSMDDSENAGYLLNEMLPDMMTYNIGISGHTILHCVNNMSDAVKQYTPSDYVILEISDIYPDEDEMLQVINKDYAKIPSYDSGILYVLQARVPAVKVLYKSIQDWRGSLAAPVVNQVGQDKNTCEDQGESFSISYHDTLSKFLHIAADAVSDSGAKLIIFYHQGAGIDENGQIINVTNQEALDLFQSTCEEQDIIFADMADPFNKLYEEEHILAHGFVNSCVGAGHLNKHGHRVIAETLSEIIKADMEGKSDVTQ